MSCAVYEDAKLGLDMETDKGIVEFFRRVMKKRDSILTKDFPWSSSNSYFCSCSTFYSCTYSCSCCRSYPCSISSYFLMNTTLFQPNKFLNPYSAMAADVQVFTNPLETQVRICSGHLASSGKSWQIPHSIWDVICDSSWFVRCILAFLSRSLWTHEE